MFSSPYLILKETSILVAAILSYFGFLCHDWFGFYSYFCLRDFGYFWLHDVILTGKLKFAYDCRTPNIILKRLRNFAMGQKLIVFEVMN